MNLMIGVASISDTDEAIIVARRGYESPFDIYDQETFESILGYAVILFDMIVMGQLLHEEKKRIGNNQKIVV
ncbi:hypothetical protein ACUL41_04015 [Virgibacillus natechei]